MLQMQYLNNKLTKTQIKHIVSNYNIKYTTMKTEIEAKINQMIQSFLREISTFFDSLEEISANKEKIKDLEKTKNELKALKEKLNEKKLSEIKLKEEIWYLNKEVERLKSNSVVEEKGKISSTKSERRISYLHKLTSSPSSPFYPISSKNSFIESAVQVRKADPKTPKASKSNIITNNGKSNNNAKTNGITKKPTTGKLKEKRFSAFVTKGNLAFNYKDPVVNASSEVPKGKKGTQENPLKKDFRRIAIMKYIKNTNIGGSRNGSNSARDIKSSRTFIVDGESLLNKNEIENGANSFNLEKGGLEQMLKDYKTQIDGELDMLEEEEQRIISMIQG